MHECLHYTGGLDGAFKSCFSLKSKILLDSGSPNVTGCLSILVLNVWSGAIQEVYQRKYVKAGTKPSAS